MKDALAIVLITIAALCLLAADGLTSDADAVVPRHHPDPAGTAAAVDGVPTAPGPDRPEMRRSSHAGADVADSATLERGRRLTRWLLDGRADSISLHMADAYRSDLGGPEGVRRAVRSIRGQIGAEESLIREEAFPRRSQKHYYRIARFTGAPGRSMTIHWAWDRDGDVVYVRVRPTPRPADTGRGDYRTKSDLRLPFRGEWYVFWGGRTAHRNYHVRSPDQRFAYDFVVLRDGRTHAGDGRDNDDYHCFGRPVLAPASGRVVSVVDTVPPNEPGRMNEDVPPGNHVVLDHGNGEYSLIAHLRGESVAVEAGDRVDRGERLGACGNSGRSSEPHVHYHLQTGPRFGEGVGLPAQFRRYVADGEIVERGEPTRGQLVRPGG